MSVSIIEGNLFDSCCQTLVNTVNCVGVMGAGIALECRLRYPEMYARYVKLCNEKQIAIGKLWIYKATDNRWILNFPTKKDWKYPSKKDYLHEGLKKFAATYQSKGIKTVAFPVLGADRGRIPTGESLQIMLTYLDPLELEVEIYLYDPRAPDKLFEDTKRRLLSQTPDVICRKSGLRKNYVSKVIAALQQPSITQLNQLAKVKGIGIRTVEKVYQLAREETTAENKNTV